jgi:hypothetical protein
MAEGEAAAVEAEAAPFTERRQLSTIVSARHRSLRISDSLVSRRRGPSRPGQDSTADIRRGYFMCVCVCVCACVRACLCDIRIVEKNCYSYGTCEDTDNLFGVYIKSPNNEIGVDKDGATRPVC